MSARPALHALDAPFCRNVSLARMLNVRILGEAMQKERNPSPDLGLGTTVLAGMGGTVLLAALFLLFSSSEFHIADKFDARKTVSYSMRPPSPVASPDK